MYIYYICSAILQTRTLEDLKELHKKTLELCAKEVGLQDGRMSFYLLNSFFKMFVLKDKATLMGIFKNITKLEEVNANQRVILIVFRFRWTYWFYSLQCFVKCYFEKIVGQVCLIKSSITLVYCKMHNCKWLIWYFLRHNRKFQIVRHLTKLL